MCYAFVRNLNRCYYTLIDVLALLKGVEKEKGSNVYFWEKVLHFCGRQLSSGLLYFAKAESDPLPREKLGWAPG